MNIEDTLAFILETQSETSETLRQISENQKRFEENQKRFDRSLRGIRTMIVAGMKMMSANQRSIKELTAAQKQTDKQLKAFLSSMEKGRNGRNHN